MIQLVVDPSCGTLCCRVVRELAVGRRIAFYKIRGEIGCGNFSHVKLGIHALTKGKTFQTISSTYVANRKCICNVILSSNTHF